MKTQNQKKKDKKIRERPLFFILIIFLNLILGIGYAEFANINLNIEGEASSHSLKEVMITDIKYVSSIFKKLSKCNNVTKFVVEEPTLNEIFIDKVGESYEE